MNIDKPKISMGIKISKDSFKSLKLEDFLIKMYLEVLLKVKTEIEEELKSLDKEISEGLFILISWLLSGSVGVVSFVFLQSSVRSIT